MSTYDARENELGERIHVRHYNYLKSMLSSLVCFEGYFRLLPRDPAVSAIAELQA